jgi:pimeloyl-ACP methyl ester carboxylesterase
MSAEPHDARVEVPGGALFVRRWRGGAGAPVLLLHDSLGSVGQWRGFPAVLAAATARDVLAYDRLGFGLSAPREDRPSPRFVEEEAETAFPALRRALGLPRVVLFGHSVGGAMALAIAAAHGEACEAVVTESTQAFVEPRTLDGIRAARERFRAEGLARLERWHGAKARWVLDAWAEVWLSPEFRGWSVDSFLGRVACPVLAIHGDSDEFGSEAFPRRIAGGVRGPSELALLERCGHVPHRERPDEIARLVARFLALPETKNGPGVAAGPGS